MSTEPTTTKTKKKKSSFWGKHRRRHIRNETLSIVWNYAAAMVRSWLGNTDQPNVDAEHRYRLQRLLPWYPTTTTTYEHHHPSTTSTTNHDSKLPKIEEEEQQQEPCFNV